MIAAPRGVNQEQAMAAIPSSIDPVLPMSARHRAAAMRGA